MRKHPYVFCIWHELIIIFGPISERLFQFLYVWPVHYFIDKSFLLLFFIRNSFHLQASLRRLSKQQRSSRRHETRDTPHRFQVASRKGQAHPASHLTAAGWTTTRRCVTTLSTSRCIRRTPCGWTGSPRARRSPAPSLSDPRSAAHRASSQRSKATPSKNLPGSRNRTIFSLDIFQYSFLRFAAPKLQCRSIDILSKSTSFNKTDWTGKKLTSIMVRGKLAYQNFQPLTLQMNNKTVLDYCIATMGLKIGPVLWYHHEMVFYKIIWGLSSLWIFHFARFLQVKNKNQAFAASRNRQNCVVSVRIWIYGLMLIFHFLNLNLMENAYFVSLILQQHLGVDFLASVRQKEVYFSSAVLKEQCHEIFCLRFFSSKQLLSVPIGTPRNDLDFFRITHRILEKKSKLFSRRV